MSTFVLKDYVATTCSALWAKSGTTFLVAANSILCPLIWEEYKDDMFLTLIPMQFRPWKILVCCLHGCAWLWDSELAKVARKKAVQRVAEPNHIGLYLDFFYWLASQTEFNYIWNSGIWTTTMAIKWNLAPKKTVCLQCVRLVWSGKCFHIPNESGIWKQHICFPKEGGAPCRLHVNMKFVVWDNILWVCKLSDGFCRVACGCFTW